MRGADMIRAFSFRRPTAPDVAAALLFGLAVWLRLHALGDPSLSFYDELTTLMRALEPDWAGVVAAVARQYPTYIDFQPPLYYLVVHAAIGLGHTEFLARLPAALGGAATVPLLYLVGRRLAGPACGLFAAAALCANLHHIDASQQVRLYAALGLVSLGAVWAVLRALDSGRWRDWALFTVFASLGLYTSYLAVAVFLVAGGLALCVLVRPAPGAPPRRRTICGLTAAAVCTAAVFVPWYAATAGMRGYLLLAGTPARPPLGEALGGMFAAFASHYADFLGRTPQPWLLAGPALVGLAAGLAAPSRRRTAVTLLLWFAACFGPVWLRANSQHHFQVRYLLPGLFPLLLLAGLAAETLLGRLRPTPGALAAVLLGTLLCLPSLTVYPFFYRRDDTRLKTLAAALDAAAGPDTALALAGGHGPWTPPYFNAFAAWYLPNRFQPSLPETDRTFRECLVLASEAGDPTLPDTAAPVARLARTAVYRLPLVHVGPTLPAPDPSGHAVFQAALTLAEAFGQIQASSNVRLEDGALVLADRSRPGQVTYAVSPLPGQAVSLESLDLAASVKSYPGAAPTGSVAVLAGDSPETLSPYDANHPPRPAPDLYLRLVLDAGPDRQPVAVTGLTAQLHIEGTPEAGATPDRTRRDRLAANTAITPFAPNQLTPGRRPLARMAAVDASRLCPDTPPALVIGNTAYLDPANCPAAGRLAPDHPLTVANPGPDPYPITRLAVSGRLCGPWLTLGQTRFQIPLSGSPLLTARLAPRGQGEAAVSPLFTDAGFVPSAAENASTAVKLPGQPVLSCRDGKPCQITYALVTGYPARSLAVTWFPRLFADPAGQNAVTASYSTDGRRYLPLDAFYSTGSGRWEGLGVARRAAADLANFTGALYIRFDLPGDAAQLWSQPEMPMSMRLALDTRSLPPLVAPPGGTPLAVDCPGDCGMVLELK